MSAILVGGVFGLLAVFLAPSLAASLPEQHRDKAQRVCRIYHTAAMRGFGRMSMLVKSHGSVVPSSMGYDTEFMAETIDNDGEDYSYTDPARMTKEYCGRPMGIVSERDNFVFTPAVAALGEARKKALQRIQGDAPPTAYPVKDEKIMVDLSMVPYARAVNPDPQLLEIVKDIIEESQSMLVPDTKKGKVMMLLGVMAGAYLVPLAAKLAMGGGAGGNVIGGVSNLVGVIYLW